MAGKSSTGEDPMDLGPFLQNYVMKNPFKAPGAVDGLEGSAERGVGGLAERVGGRSTGRWCGSWPRVTAAALRSRRRRRGSRSASSVLNGDDDDDVDNNDDDMGRSADQLLKNDHSASSEAQVTAWLRENYRHMSVPGRHRAVCQHLLLRVQQVFPDVTADAIDYLVLAAFPTCVKRNNKKNGLAFYQGLVARPDPEVFENPLFIAALDSVASRLLTLSQAADKFGIRESALKAAVTWSDVVQRSDVLTTSAAAAVSTHSNQSSDGLLSKASQKRVHVTDDEQPGPCRRRRCHKLSTDDDDVDDFEMMLQDISTGGSVGGESSKLHHSQTSRTQSPELVTVKLEPGCDEPQQPLNFSLSATSTSTPADGTWVRSGDTTPSTDVAGTKNCTGDNSDAAQLQRDLTVAVETNLALQEELSARDFHLAQLAEDFFCLHEQFKQLARHFQTVLGDIQRPVPSTDQSNAITQRISENHTS